MAQPQHWQPDPPTRADAVEAHLNYLADTGERPVTYARSLPSGSRVEGPNAEPHRVRVENARYLTSPPALDRNGFQLLSHRSALTDFSREELIRGVYYVEAIEAIRQATGAAKVVVFDHTLRYAKPNHGEVGIREPGYYFPDQAPDEVLLLEIFDSRTDGTARLTAHTAFDDPASPPDALPRRSIELRTLVFWD